MIYSYNTLGFYKTISNRQFDNTGNQRVLHHFETNKIPNVQLVIDSNITSATYQLYDDNNTIITSGTLTREQSTNEAGTAYTRLILKGATTTGKDDGFYYLKIIYTGGVAYSDVFCWQTDVSDYLKISAVSSNVLIGEFELNLSNFEYLVYLEANDSSYEYEINEEGVEKTYGNVPLFNSRNKINEFEITGYSKTHDFIAGLRTLWANGTITLTYKGDEFEVYDIENPDKTESFSYSDIIILTIRFKRKDYLQTKNTL